MKHSLPSKITVLKCWPNEFIAIHNGEKTYEIRSTADREFNVHDWLCLQEFDPEIRTYSGRQLFVMVVRIDHGPNWGLQDKVCVMGIKLMLTDGF
jgi:hypothetical protein